MDVCDFARQILEMENELRWLRAENAKLRDYRDKYDELLMDGIRHSETMLGGILKVAMTPGVVLEAIESDRSADLAEQRTGGRE